MTARANYYKLNRAAIDGLSDVGKLLASINPRLRALVELRVSQINGCAFCLDRHSVEAREAGETQQRLDCLIAWRESRMFDDAERAAPEWAEALTNISDTHAPEAAYDGLIAHFSESQIVDLTLIIAMMNMWNRIAISHRTQPPKR